MEVGATVSSLPRADRGDLEGPGPPPAGPFVALASPDMAGAAAIFDLDRTLLRTSSTPAINRALFQQGVAHRESVRRVFVVQLT